VRRRGRITAPTLCLVVADDDETPPSYSQYLADHSPDAGLVNLRHTYATSLVNAGMTLQALMQLLATQAPG
jgi:hypothetical protein